jgi:hypothetical protein
MTRRNSGYKWRACVRGLLLLSFLLCASLAGGQEIDAPRVGVLVVRTASPLLTRPVRGARTLGIINASRKLLWVEGQEDGGYLRVVGQFGPVGWVAANDVQVLQPPPGPLSAESLKTPPCETSLSTCPPNGCAPVNSAEALANEAKRRIPVATGNVLLEFSDLGRLQNEAQGIVGQRTVPKNRGALSSFRVSSGTVGEGSAVLVSGFIGVNNPGPHPNTGESVNCNLTPASENDFHINITPGANQAQFGGIVVEMIPQGRPGTWSIAKLETLRQKQVRVLVAGSLFYDSIHVVNDDPQHPIGGQPQRFSLWEIHPISNFFVCGRADNQCDPRAKADWIPLADFVPN